MMLQTPAKPRISDAEFEKLYSEYNLRFVEVACRYVRDRGVAEDLVSDSFVAFYEERERLPERLNAPAYLLTIVKNRCLNHLRARLLHMRIEQNLHSTQQRLIEADIRSLAACEPDGLISEEMQAMLERAVARMPELTRKVFLGSRYDNKSYRELAEELHIAFTHVNFEMRRALKILREEFRDYICILLILLGISWLN